MAKILHAGEWYEQVSSEAIYEEEFEKIVTLNASHLFPSHFLIPFKMTVYSSEAAAKADFAIVDRAYREWWVVEAELSHHSFVQHVEPQVLTLSKAVYGEDVAHYLKAKEPQLDIDRMLSVVKGQPPRVLVLVNAPTPTWSMELRRYGAIVMMLEIFRSRQNKHVYRVNGDAMPDRAKIGSECVVEISRFLRVLSPGILAARHGDSISVSFRGGIMPWSRTDLADRVYLSCAKPVSLDSRKRYELILKEDGSLTLSEIN